VGRSAPNFVGILSDHRYTPSLKKISCSVSKPQQLKVERWSAIRPTIALFDPHPCKNLGRGRGDVWVNDSSCTCDRTSGIYFMGGLAAAAERRVPVKKEKQRKKLTGKA